MACHRRSVPHTLDGKGRRPAWRAVRWLAACQLLPALALLVLTWANAHHADSVVQSSRAGGLMIGPLLFALWTMETAPRPGGTARRDATHVANSAANRFGGT